MTTLLTDLGRLHRGILESPHDDTLRLIYADALDDDGQHERAEFIRVDVNISRICQGNRDDRPEPDAHRLDIFLTRQSELMFGVWELGWLDPLPREYISDSVHSRGFLDHIRLPLTAFLEHAAALFAAHPITSVTLTCRELGDWGGDHYRYGWERREWTWRDYSWGLPDELFEAMRDAGFGQYGGPGCLGFSSPEDADEALAQTVVIFGRSLAKLPPLA